MRIVLLGYHNLGCIALKALIKHKIIVPAVITHKDNADENRWYNSLADLSKSARIKVYYSEDYDDLELFKLIEKIHPDVIMSVYFRRLIKDDLLAIPNLGAVNLHGSLLPKYRGRVPVNWQIINGEKEGGLTLHYMVEKPDAGDIISQIRVPIEKTDSALTLYRKLEIAAIKLFDNELPIISEWRNKAQSQDNNKATVYKGRKPEDGLIDWTLGSENIYNLVRGVTEPYPGAFTFLDDKKIIIWETAINRPSKPNNELNPGEIMCEKEKVFIKSGDGWLEIIKTSLEKRNREIIDVDPQTALIDKNNF